VIRYSLHCHEGHGFDAWFSSGASYDEQIEAGAIRCPTCGSAEVRKAPMAPAVLRGKSEKGPKGAALPTDTEPRRTFAVLKGLREHLKANAEDVGTGFPEEARKIHYGEAEERNIYGEATLDEAKSLNEEGIPVLPLPPLPEEHN
jgi:hypothetical protein